MTCVKLYCCQWLSAVSGLHTCTYIHWHGYNLTSMGQQGLIQDFVPQHTLTRRVWGHAPQKVLKFTTSETASGGNKKNFITIYNIMLGNFQGGGKFRGPPPILIPGQHFRKTTTCMYLHFQCSQICHQWIAVLCQHVVAYPSWYGSCHWRSARTQRLFLHEKHALYFVKV